MSSNKELALDAEPEEWSRVEPDDVVLMLTRFLDEASASRSSERSGIAWG